MKISLVWLPLAFVLGGLVGYFGPAEDLRALKEVRGRDADRRTSRAASGFDSFAELTHIPKEARRRPPSRRTRPSETEGERATGPSNAVSEVAGPAPERKPPKSHLAPEDLEARIGEAAELWRTRTALKRAAVVENLGLDEKGAAAFDHALAEMNAKIRESMQALADQLAATEGGFSPELGVRLMGDLATSVAETYDALGDVVDASRRAELSKLQVYEFVDPSSAEPLISVQDKLEGSPLPFGKVH